MTLEPTQFNQLVNEVREALALGSQGVGEVEIVSSLANIVSLPAQHLLGDAEKIVAAPIELLSAPAVEAAADAHKATEDAIIAAVNAEAAADLTEAERKDLEELKERTVIAGEDAAAKGDKAFRAAAITEDATLYAMLMCSHLQTKLEQAQVVILSGLAHEDVMKNLDSQVKDSIIICASTRDEAYSTILQLRELQMQVAQAIVDAYVAYDGMKLSTAESRQATAIANKATERICELSERTERVIIESVLQTGEAKQTIIRLEDLAKDVLLSKMEADIAASHAAANAELAKQATDEAELVKREAILVTKAAKEATDKAEKAADNAIFSTANADTAAYLAREKAQKAEKAAEETLKTKAEADHAATAALAAEQRALDAAATAENIVSGIRPDWDEQDKTNSNYIANKPEIPTLETAPTDKTLTYINRDGKAVNFKIGDEVRVLEDDEYTFYKLYDLVDGVAFWDEVGGSLKQNIYLTGADYLTDNIIEQGILKRK